MSKLLTEDRLQDMLKHPYKTNWRRVFECFEVTEEQVRRVTKYMDAAAWSRVSHHKCFSESFLREFKNKIFWFDVYYDNLSMDFIREMKKHLDYAIVTCRLQCDEDFKMELLSEIKC